MTTNFDKLRNDPAFGLIIQNPPDVVKNIEIPDFNIEYLEDFDERYCDLYNEDELEAIKHVLTSFYNFYYDKDKNILCNDNYFKNKYDVEVVVSLKDATTEFNYNTFVKFARYCYERDIIDGIERDFRHIHLEGDEIVCINDNPRSPWDSYEYDYLRNLVSEEEYEIYSKWCFKDDNLNYGGYVSDLDLNDYKDADYDEKDADYDEKDNNCNTDEFKI